eukprot:scaffold129498_cov63-Phaeocystis_antarctica.AAC.4
MLPCCRAADSDSSRSPASAASRAIGRSSKRVACAAGDTARRSRRSSASACATKSRHGLLRSVIW